MPCGHFLCPERQRKQNALFSLQLSERRKLPIHFFIFFHSVFKKGHYWLFFITRQFSFLLEQYTTTKLFTTQLTYAFIMKAACMCFLISCHLVRFTYLPFNYLCPRLSLTATAFTTTAFVGQALQVEKGYYVSDEFTAHKKSICSNYQ